ncbi:hypothetical protein P6F26_08530 [Roseibacterium sp. SDUM158017]|uniref:hypothetical protein n=1 Tax=Roseicyclus salinarum TaxID=3036773 RepID=UPI00241553D5|nr:hypothetical protein [Roseibacterium sp. SDUM158017]MDG4648490.1 hypothetical protein [Roseibacterium sp. SDUM158017]
MTDTRTIRRRPDGSIDTAFYMNAGRRHRSEAAHGIAGRAARRTRSASAPIAALLAFIPFLDGRG